MADVTGYTLPGHEGTYMYADAKVRSYGYGEPTEFITGDGETELETAIDAIVATMSNGEVKQIRFSDGSNGISKGMTFSGRLVRYFNGYIALLAESYAYNGAKVQKIKYNGKWYPFEWENPPMEPGVEYRTTERFNGQPVYTKLVNLGSFTGTTTIAVGNGYKSYIRVHAIAQYSGKTYFEKVPDTMVKDYQNAGIHYIQVLAGDTSITNGFVQIWYL